MCGIVGKISAEAPIDQALVEQMCEVVEHRGPDSRGIFLEGNVGLGIQRLRIIDLERGDQPLFNEDRSIVVVFNGEIYNHEELRNSLSGSGHTFYSRSDTEVIVHLYEDLGVDFVDHLRGMFALALWDSHRRRLVLARDRLGKKPLYYSFDGATLWFASEPKSILQDPSVRRDVDFAALDAYLHYLYVPDNYCAFASLSKVPPAHRLVYEGGRVELERYWALTYRPQLELSDAEACERIREQLLEATSIRLRSDVPLGAFLSGGVDSSAVVATMAQRASGRVKTFTIGFPVEGFDERAHARNVARIFDTDHHEFVVEPDIGELLGLLAWHYGEPFADQSAIPSFYLSRMTREHVTVALNGDGGDENFGGYRRYVGNDAARRLERLPAPVTRLVAAAVATVGTGPAQDTARARLRRLLRALPLDPAARYAMWIACFDVAERRLLYTPNMLEKVRDNDVQAVIRAPYDRSDGPTLVERLLDVDTQTYLAGQLLVKMDIASMAHSLEVRSPFLDHEFMQFVARLPLSAKVTGTTGKRLLKQAIRPWLPDHVLDRPKRGFTMPIARWLRNELRWLVDSLLLDQRTLDRGLFRREAIERLVVAHQRGKQDNSNKLWALMQLELWFRTYVDRRPSGPIALELGQSTVAPI